MKSKQVVGILDQISLSFRKENRLAFVLSALLGGFLPIMSFAVAHNETQTFPYLWALVAGGLAFSAITVYKWGVIAFGLPLKAAGFVLLIEGCAVFSHIEVINFVALFVLVFINATSTAYTLISERKQMRAEIKASSVTVKTPKKVKAKRKTATKVQLPVPAGNGLASLETLSLTTV